MNGALGLLGERTMSPVELPIGSVEYRVFGPDVAGNTRAECECECACASWIRP